MLRVIHKRCFSPFRPQKKKKKKKKSPFLEWKLLVIPKEKYMYVNSVISIFTRKSVVIFFLKPRLLQGFSQTRYQNETAGY